MATVRGSVIRFDHKNWKLIIQVHEYSGVIETDWPADLYIDQGAAADIQEDGTFIYPVASCSKKEGS